MNSTAPDFGSLLNVCRSHRMNNLGMHAGPFETGIIWIHFSLQIMVPDGVFQGKGSPVWSILHRDVAFLNLFQLVVLGGKDFLLCESLQKEGHILHETTPS